MKKLLTLIIFLIPLQGHSQDENPLENDSQKMRFIAAKLWLPIYESFSFQYRTYAMLNVCGKHSETEEQLKRLNSSTLDDIIKIVEVEIQREENNFNIANDEILATKTKDLAWSLYLQLTTYGSGYREALSLTASSKLSTGTHMKEVICTTSINAADRVLSQQ